jgi:FHA domain
MNAPIVVQILRFGFLALLWIFIFATLRVVRADLAGAGAARSTMPTRPAASPRPRPKRRGKALTHVLVTEGGLAGTRITLSEQQPIMIGRANDSTLVLTDDYASTRHARLVSRDGDWYVEDLGSTNGTYLDRTKVSTPTLIPPGVPIRIGKTVLELRS